MSNANYDKYLNMLMKNYPLETEKEDSDVLYGGTKTDGSVPFGGFPPIYLCSDKNEQLITQQNKSREYSTHKNAVSIKDIMQKRREVIPFITD